MKILLIITNAEDDPFKKQYPFTPLIFPILKSCAPEHEYSFVDMMYEDLSSLNYNGEFDLIALSFRVSATEKFKFRPFLRGGQEGILNFLYFLTSGLSVKEKVNKTMK